MAGRRTKCQKKQKKSNDQRAPVTRYYLSQSLDMKYYLVTGGLSSVTKPCNNYHYLVTEQMLYQTKHSDLLDIKKLNHFELKYGKLGRNETGTS